MNKLNQKFAVSHYGVKIYRHHAKDGRLLLLITVSSPSSVVEYSAYKMHPFVETGPHSLADKYRILSTRPFKVTEHNSH